LRADLFRAIVLVVAVGAAGGCASGRGSFSKAEKAARAGDWDLAVTPFTEAVQASPQSAESS